ncbi:MAG: site-specific integrase [Bacteroidota bacterium]
MKPIPQRVSTAIILETVRVKKDGTSLLKLRVTFDRKSKYYTLKNESSKKILLGELSFASNEPFALTPKVFKHIMAKNPQEEYLIAKQLLDKIRRKSVDLIKDIPDFTFDAFENSYFSKDSPEAGDEKDLFVWLKRLAKDMRDEGRISTAVTYECALGSLSTFTSQGKLLLSDFTTDFLKKYAAWMEKEKKSPTTTGIYLRAVRVAYNKAMKKGLVTPEKYPFGKRSDEKFPIPNGANVKKALTIKQVGDIANCKLEVGSVIRRYRDYWLFCYLANGMNVKDMAQLKYKNIDQDKLTFIREKTRRETASNPKIITVVITHLVARIIKEWGNNPAEPESYIFPILEVGATPVRQYKLIQQETKMINTYIAIVAKKVKIKEKVTSYVSRHSFATVLKRSGVSTEFIKESLGHSNLATTEKYLAGFEDAEQRKNADKLTKF